MDPSYIVPFITSIQNVFSMMLQLEVNVGDPSIKQGNNATYDISGIIGVSGDIVGSIVLSFPQDVAESVVALFCGEQISVDSPDFADAIGELVNMVSGNAKAEFGGKKASISCPTVVMGEGHTIATQSDTPCVIIPCSTDCGDLAIEVSIRENQAETTDAAASNAATTA